MVKDGRLTDLVRPGSLGRVQNCQSDFSAQLNTCEDKLGWLFQTNNNDEYNNVFPPGNLILQDKLGRLFKANNLI